MNYESNKNWASVHSSIDWDEVAGTAVDKNGNVILFARGKTSVIVLSRQGEFLKTIGDKDFLRPHSVRVDSENYLWFVDDVDHTVKKYDLDGNKLMTIGIPNSPAKLHSGLPFNRCTDVAIDYDTESVFISDGYGNSSVHKFIHLKFFQNIIT